MITLNRILCPLACALAITAAGCGQQKTANTEYVEGIVTLDGQPVEGATVTFVPTSDDQGAPATGRTDAAGVYKLTAALTGEERGKAEAGTKPGTYYVGVIKNTSTVELSEEEAQEQGIEYVAPSGPSATPTVTYIVPKRYNTPRTSGLEVTVTEGDNRIPLELTSKP